MWPDISLASIKAKFFKPKTETKDAHRSNEPIEQSFPPSTAQNEPARILHQPIANARNTVDFSQAPALTKGTYACGEMTSMEPFIIQTKIEAYLVQGIKPPDKSKVGDVMAIGIKKDGQPYAVKGKNPDVNILSDLASQYTQESPEDFKDPEPLKPITVGPAEGAWPPLSPPEPLLLDIQTTDGTFRVGVNVSHPSATKTVDKDRRMHTSR